MFRTIEAPKLLFIHPYWLIISGTLFVDSNLRSNNLNCLLTPNITQVRASERDSRHDDQQHSFGWAIRSSPGVKHGAHGDLMQLGQLCGNFTNNLHLHKLVLLSKGIISPSHTCLFLPCTTPSLEPAPSDISVCLFSAVGQDRSGFLVCF